MKKQLLEYIIRECVKEVLEAFPQEPETVGAPAPPAAGQGTADQPPVPQENPATGAPPVMSAKGLLYVDPKKPMKPQPIQVTAPQDPGKLERELYRTAARSGGPRVKVSSAALREVPKVLANPASALYLYIGKQNPDDDDSELYLLPAKTLQQAQQSSIQPGVSAEHPTTQIAPREPGIEMPQQGPEAAQKTMAPDIDEDTSLRGMLSSMIKEALRTSRK